MRRDSVKGTCSDGSAALPLRVTSVQGVRSLAVTLAGYLSGYYLTRMKD